LDSYLFLVTLRTASEVISAQELPKPSGREPSQKELQMARQLISAMEGHFDASEYKDEYRERLMTFIESKAKGHKPRLSPAKKKRASTSLDSVLARSIAALKKGKKAA
jgi:DNA end-binding protein Ku